MSAFNYDESFEDAVRSLITKACDVGIVVIEDALADLNTKLDAHFVNVKNVAVKQWGIKWMAENAIRNVYLDGASMTPTEQAALYIGILGLSSDIGKLHDRKMSLVTARAFTIPKISEEIQAFETKINERIDIKLSELKNAFNH
jgi:hypothetical protein